MSHNLNISGARNFTSLYFSWITFLSNLTCHASRLIETLSSSVLEVSLAGIVSSTPTLGDSLEVALWIDVWSLPSLSWFYKRFWTWERPFPEMLLRGDLQIIPIPRPQATLLCPPTPESSIFLTWGQLRASALLLPTLSCFLCASPCSAKFLSV